MNVGHQISKTDFNICHPVPSRNLKKPEVRTINAKFVRRQGTRGLMANKKSLNDWEEKIFNDDDITLLKARLAKASFIKQMNLKLL